MNKYNKNLKLFSLFGVGNNIKSHFIERCGINKRINPIYLKYRHFLRLHKTISNIETGKVLKENVKKNILNLIKIKTYKGIRHKTNYPVRGQRTHTNAKTSKKTLR